MSLNPTEMKRLAELRQKKAHGAVALKNPDVMLYMIESDSNKSKFYEMKVVPMGQETPAKVNKDLSKGSPGYVLMRRWGRLTDSASTGRVDSENDIFASEREAQRALDIKKREKTGKGYQVADRGMYPIGLGAAGFGWGGQAACEYVPELRDLQKQLSDMQNSSMRFSRILHEMKQMRSSLVGTITPMYDKLLDDIADLNSILESQLSKCHGSSRYASGCGATSPGQKLIVDMDNGKFALQTVADDPPYCQSYTTELLIGPPLADALAKQIGAENRKMLERMSLYDAWNFVNAEIKKRSKRPINPRWHHYVMPD